MNARTTIFAALTTLLALSLAGCNGMISGGAGGDEGATNGPTRGCDATTDPACRPAPRTCEGCVGASPLNRLLHDEYVGVVRQAFGEAANDLPFSMVPGNGRSDADLFESNHIPFDEAGSGVAAFAQFAEEAAIILAAGTGCDGAECAEAFIRAKASILFRREPLEDEAGTFLALLAGPPEATTWSIEDGIRLALTGLLQSPQLIYVIEVGEAVDDEGLTRIVGREMANRLALFFWRQGPSPELIAAAEAGELDTAAGVGMHSRAMLEDARSDAMVQTFFQRLLHLDRFGQQPRYEEGTDLAADYPGLPGVADDMLAETDTFVVALMRGSGSFRDLYTADYTYASDELAAYYGAAPGTPDGHALPRVTFDGSEARSGVLTHGSVIGANTTVEDYRGVHRGKFLAKHLLCQNIPAPPSDIDIPTPIEGVSPRERFESQTDSASCQGCHGFLNPAGFLLEHFDGGGRYSDTIEGFAVDSSGALPTVEGDLGGTRDLGAALAGSEAAQRCMARRWFQYALGRDDDDADQASVEDAFATFRESDLDLRELVVAVTMTNAFRHRQRR